MIQGMQMTDQDLSDYLAAKGAAVVRLSHHSVMNPTRPNFPDDSVDKQGVRERVGDVYATSPE